MKKGFSLLELLVVVGIFAILASISTQIIAQSLRGARKSEASITVRENVDYMFAVMERVFRNAKSLNCSASNDKLIYFTDEEGKLSSFQCHGGSGGYISYDSANISGDNVIIDCNQIPIFVCTQTDGTTPPSVEINIEAREAQNAGTEGASISNSTKIILRSY